MTHRSRSEKKLLNIIVRNTVFVVVKTDMSERRRIVITEAFDCINYKGKKLAFYKTYVGVPACVGTVEDTLAEIKTDKYVVFGAAGCLNKEIARGKVMIPTQAYRDEGTSYHKNTF